MVLSDTVESRGTKRRTEDLVDEVTGVKDINNNLKINKTESSTVSNDKYGEQSYQNGRKKTSQV